MSIRRILLSRSAILLFSPLHEVVLDIYSIYSCRLCLTPDPFVLYLKSRSIIGTIDILVLLLGLC